MATNVEWVRNRTPFNEYMSAVAEFPVAWWRHQTEAFSALLALCAGNSPVTGEFPAQSPVTRCFDVFFDLRMNKRLGKQREAGDLRRHHTHYDVIVMGYCTIGS